MGDLISCQCPSDLRTSNILFANWGWCGKHVSVVWSGVSSGMDWSQLTMFTGSTWPYCHVMLPQIYFLSRKTKMTGIKTKMIGRNIWMETFGETLYDINNLIIIVRYNIIVMMLSDNIQWISHMPTELLLDLSCLLFSNFSIVTKTSFLLMEVMRMSWHFHSFNPLWVVF